MHRLQGLSLFRELESLLLTVVILNQLFKLSLLLIQDICQDVSVFTVDMILLWLL